MIKIIGGIATYQFGTMEDAIRRMNQWIIDGLVSEEELCGFIVQLFYEIPESTYNDIIDRG